MAALIGQVLLPTWLDVVETVATQLQGVKPQLCFRECFTNIVPKIRNLADSIDFICKAVTVSNKPNYYRPFKRIGCVFPYVCDVRPIDSCNRFAFDICHVLSSVA